MSPKTTVPLMRAPLAQQDLADWGPVPTLIEGASRTAGRVIFKGAGGPECGYWTCTPGTWRCVLESDEFCHFLEGRATYTHDDGEVIEITPDTAAYFAKGWSGTCVVHETVRKVYMIR